MAMKLTSALAASMLTMVALPAAAADRLPAIFVGQWCMGPNAPDYSRGRCPDDSDGNLTISPNGVDVYDHEMTCKVIKATAKKGGNHLIKFRCSSEDGTWTENFLMSVVGKRLVMNRTIREP
jgi:hypothetical protein